MSEMKTCPRHNLAPGWCSACDQELRDAPDPDTMTPDERVEEMRRLGGPSFWTFDLLHKRIEALCGRSVWTHEFALWDLLVEEARTRQHPSIEGVIDRAQMLMGDKPVIVAEMPPRRD